MPKYFTTENGTKYELVAEGPKGRVGVTEDGGRRRIRVEPKHPMYVPEMSFYLGAYEWQQPTTHKLRFLHSCSPNNLEIYLDAARRAIGNIKPKVSKAPVKSEREQIAEFASAVEKAARS